MLFRSLLLTKNLVADLQESLPKDVLSFSERFSKGLVTFPLRILIHFEGLRGIDRNSLSLC